MTRTFDIELSESSIEGLVRYLESYSASLESRTLFMAEDMASAGLSTAVSAIASSGAVEDGELIDSVVVDTVGGDVALVAYSDHAAFVEFGTGVIGKGAPYGGVLPPGVSWPYDVNSHSTDGWLYYDDGRFRWTMGMPSRPFMAPAAAVMRSVMYPIAKGYLQLP